MSRIDRDYLKLLRARAETTIAEIKDEACGAEADAGVQMARLLEHFRRIVTDVDSILENERANLSSSRSDQR